MSCGICDGYNGIDDRSPCYCCMDDIENPPTCEDCGIGVPPGSFGKCDNCWDNTLYFCQNCNRPAEAQDGYCNACWDELSACPLCQKEDAWDICDDCAKTIPPEFL